MGWLSVLPDEVMCLHGAVMTEPCEKCAEEYRANIAAQNELAALRAYMAAHAPMELRAFDVREK